jgi:hypothetical protein
MTICQLGSGSGRRGRAWLGETPALAEVTSAGIVETYWNNPGPSVSQEVRRAAFEVMVPSGGRILYGLLGGEFRPHDYNFLRICVDLATPERDYEDGVLRSLGQKVGLPDYVCGGVLAGAVHDPSLLGQGAVRFRWGAITDVGSSWETFRLLAVGVIRLLAADDDTDPVDLMPYFNGPGAPPPGGHRT